MDNVRQIMIVFFVCLFLARPMGHCFLSSGEVALTQKVYVVREN